MLWTILYCLGAVLALALLLLVAAWAKWARVPSTNVPGPPSSPILGCLPLIFKAGPRRNIHTTLLQLHRQYGPMVGLPMPGRILIGLSKGDHITHVLRHPKVFGRTVTLKRGVGAVSDGLLILEGEKWKRHRRLLQPLFHPTSLQRVDPATNEACDKLAARLEAARGLVNIAMHGWYSRLSLDVIGEVGFGGSFGCLDARPSAASELLTSAIGRIMYGASLRTKAFPIMWPFLSDKRVFYSSRRHVREYLVEQLAKVRAESGKEFASERGTSILSLMMKDAAKHQAAAGGTGGGPAPLTDKEMVDELFMFYMAGHETTSNSLSWMTLMLARHPEIVARMQREVAEVVGPQPEGSTAPVTLEHIKNLPYLTAFMYETMRMHPVAPLTGRMPNTDTEIGGYKVAAGSILILGFLPSHMSPDNFPDPKTFKPERWLPDPEAAVAARKAFFFPFGAGPQNCIGRDFAKIEMKITLARLVQWLGPRRCLRPSLNPPRPPLPANDDPAEADPAADTTKGDADVASAQTITAFPRHGVWVDVVPVS